LESIIFGGRSGFELMRPGAAIEADERSSAPLWARQDAVLMLARGLCLRDRARRSATSALISEADRSTKLPTASPGVESRDWAGMVAITPV